MKINTQTPQTREDEREAERRRAVLRAQLAMAFGGAVAALERGRAASDGGPVNGRGPASAGSGRASHATA